MSPKPVYELLESIRKRYKQALRTEKTVILNEFCANYNCHRKSAIRRIRQKPYQKQKISYKIKGRPYVYHDKNLIEILDRVWTTAYFHRATHPKAYIPIWLPHYENSFKSIPDNTK